MAEAWSVEQFAGAQPPVPTEPVRPGRPPVTAPTSFSVEQFAGTPAPSGFIDRTLQQGREVLQGARGIASRVTGALPGGDDLTRVDQFLPGFLNPLEGLRAPVASAGRQAGSAGQFIDALTGIAREVVGAPLYVGGRIAAQTQGASQGDAAAFAKQFKNDVLDRIPGSKAVFAPFATIADSLGGEYKKAYEDNPVATVFGWITKGIEKGSEKAGKAAGIPAADLEQAAAMAMTALGGKGVQMGLREAALERAAGARRAATKAGQEAAAGVLREADRRGAQRAEDFTRLEEQTAGAQAQERSLRARQLVEERADLRDRAAARVPEDTLADARAQGAAEEPSAAREQIRYLREQEAAEQAKVMENTDLQNAVADALAESRKPAGPKPHIRLKSSGAATPEFLRDLATISGLGVATLPAAAWLLNKLDPDRNHTIRSILGLEPAGAREAREGTNDVDITPTNPYIRRDPEPRWNRYEPPGGAFTDDDMPQVPLDANRRKIVRPRETLSLTGGNELPLEAGDVEKLREDGLWQYVAPAVAASVLGVKGGREAFRGMRQSELPAPSPARRGEAGFIDPRLLKIGALYGTSAALGAYLDSDQRLRGAALATLGMAGFRHLQGSEAAKTRLDELVGLTSTRVGKVAGEEVKRALRDYEMNTMTTTGNRLDAVEGLARDLAPSVRDRIKTAVGMGERLAPAEREALNLALLSEDVAGAREILARNPKVAEHYAEVRGTLDAIGKEQRALGRFGEGIPEYFPRVVKDYEGLKAALGEEVVKGLDLTLAAADKAQLEKVGRPLSPVERSVLIDNWFKAQSPSSFPPGFIRNRSVQVTPELAKFYEPPSETLINYIGEATRDIETARFFGRDLKSAVKEGRTYTDLEGSVGSYVERLMKEKKMDSGQAAQLRNILSARFGPGEQAPAPFWQHLMNTTNAALLGSAHSAATQIADLIMVPAHQGLVPTLKAVRQALTGDSTYTPQDFQLGNHIAAELGRGTWSGKTLQAILAPLFKPIDMFAKKVTLNASLEKNAALLRRDPAAFEKKWRPAFGEDLPALIRDLKEGKAESPEVRSMVFTELSDVQPISRSEMPQAWLQHPDGRILYQLKSFMLKQTDIIRRRAYDEIASGTPEGIKKGTSSLVALGTMYTLSNVPPDLVKDLLSGRNVDLDKIDYMDALLKNFGVSRYTLDKAAGKPYERLLAQPWEMIKPPIVDMGKYLDKPEKLTAFVPLVGRSVYDRELGGNEARERGRAMSEKAREGRVILDSLGEDERAVVQKWRRATKAEKADMRHDPAVLRALQSVRDARQGSRQDR